MIPSWLIYHPQRKKSVIGNLTIYHDNFGSNEDPYIWHNKFLHTYCHITQLTNVEGQINFWVSGDKYPRFTRLFCDCIFVIDKKYPWTQRNHINRCDPLIDNNQTFEHHYKWVNPPHNHHHFNKRQRYTLKANSKKSFQPQDNKGNLIDILPFLNHSGVTSNKLIRSMTSKRGTRPFQLDNNLGQKLYDYLICIATIKLFGSQLKNKHPNRVPTNERGHC